MVLLRHADGYMTAYGHNGEILVRKGQKVRRGQIISKVGSTGNVSVPQLHFEIRKGKAAVNPAKFIKGLS
jgi:murein DD-endopeptidase MepM/ murein hydrolase activator NlpD